tara:strand:- start:1229 stop:1402 length:174 start_codon:yes stop_codon:yes gene_type:complete
MESCAHVAQLAEHVLGKDEVMRSIRVVGSIRLSAVGFYVDVFLPGRGFIPVIPGLGL